MMECRLCLTSTPAGEFVSIRAYPQRILSCCHLQVIENDQLPDTICTTCESNLKSFADFKMICRQNDETRRSKLEKFWEIKTEEIVIDDLAWENGLGTSSSQSIRNFHVDGEEMNINDMTQEDPKQRERRLARERQRRWRARQETLNGLNSSQSTGSEQLDAKQTAHIESSLIEININNMRERCMARERQRRWRARQETLNRLHLSQSEALEKADETQVDNGGSTFIEINVDAEDPTQRERRLARERMRRWRARQNQETLETLEQAETRKAAQARYQRLRLQSQTPEQVEARRAARIRSEKLRLQSQTPEQAEARRAYQARYQKLRLETQTPEQIEAKRAARARYERSRLKSQTPEQVEAIRAACARSQTLTLQTQTPEQAEATPATDAATSDRKMKRFKCDICSKAFMSPSHLNTHTITHLGVKAFKCDVCSKAFALKYNLSQHMKIHIGHKPHKCELCPRAFFHKCDLRDHVKIHTGEGLIKCEVCSKTFVHKSSLVRHLPIHIAEKQ